jgi:hypothetical protein
MAAYAREAVAAFRSAPPSMKSWERHHREAVREFLMACTGPDWPRRGDQAERLLRSLPEEVAGERAGRGAAAVTPTGRIDKSALAFAPPSGRSPKAARRAERAAGPIGRLRFTVMDRARRWFGNVCEFCRAGEPETMHHVLKGSERVTHEDETSCAAVCDACDKRTEESPAWARTRGLLWARRMADEARRRGRPESAAGFERTAEILEGKIALAEAKGIGKVDTTP